MSGKTLYQKLWDSHVVKDYAHGESLLYIDRHLVQEVSSPMAFSSLAARNIAVRQPEKSLAVVDHVVPTKIPLRANLTNNDAVDRHQSLDAIARTQTEALERNTQQHNIPYLPLNSVNQGIAHVVGPELGFTLPGTTLVCGDSHTATHGAFGSLAFGIGTSECEKVFATQCLRQTRAKTMRITINGDLSPLISSKDLALAIIRTIGSAGGTGYAIEYAGDTIRSMSMEQRMTLCNLTIEAGARVGLVAPDKTTFEYIRGRPYAPHSDYWEQAITYWQSLVSDTDAVFDQEISMDATQIAPTVTWGTSPDQSSPITGRLPLLEEAQDGATARRWKQAFNYMQLKPADHLQGLTIDWVFIGSCTNGRIEDLRIAAHVIDGRQVADHVSAIVVPGSGLVKAQAEDEGLDRIFTAAGFEWRAPGCSMCVAMNNDRLNAGERCASTSNRNFEGRQGTGGMTHLMSPAMAAAAAVSGHITDVRQL